MNNGIKKKLLLILIFASAMGMLEAVVVVYLRFMFYPGGFRFPLAVIPDSIAKAELLREICTIIMLLALAWLAGKDKVQIFSFFLFSFAVWDIIYYAGLKLLLDWPQSFFTWDILFLIPIPWVGPVLAPLIASFTMIILALLFLFLTNRSIAFKANKKEWLLIYLGAAVIFVSFIWDYAQAFTVNHVSINIFSSGSRDSLNRIIAMYIPYQFRWEIFWTGILLVYLSMFLIIKRNTFVKLLPENNK